MRRTVLMFACMVLVTLTCSSAAWAQNTVVVHRSQASAAEVVAYWTPERMASARPLNPTPRGVRTPPVEGMVPEGHPGAILSAGQGGLPLLEASPEDLAELAQEVALPSGYSYPPPENTWAIPKTWYGSYPLRTVGKVYFTRGGWSFMASGGAVGNRGVITAASVLHGGAGSEWSSNVLFIPALRETWKPYGEWAMFDGIVPTVWTGDTNWCRNIGFFVVSDRSGKTLQETVGHLGFAWDQGINQAWTGIGYPGTDWSGKIMVATNASHSSSDAVGGCTPASIGMGSRQSDGANIGGPWILKYRAQQWGGMNYANGVFSYHWASSQPDEWFSPYIDSWVKTELYDWAMGQ